MAVAPKALEIFTATCKAGYEAGHTRKRKAEIKNKKEDRKFAVEFSRKKFLMDNCLQQAMTAIKRQQEID